MMLGIHQRERETQQTCSVMVVTFFAHLSQIGAMVLLLSLERIEQESCAFAQIKALEERDWWLYPYDSGYGSERESRQT